MMHYPQDPHSWNKLYREERLDEARDRNLRVTARADHEATTTGGRVGGSLGSVLSLILAGAGAKRAQRLWP